MRTGSEQQLTVFPLRFSAGTLQNHPLPTLIERWRYLDGLGFDTLWLTDHFANPYGLADPWFDGWTLLSGLVAHTARARLGVLVTNITYRNPALLARQALTLDHLSGGRLELALGPGGQSSDYAMTGVGPWDAAERVARCGEFVEVVDRLLCNTETTLTGMHYRVDGAVMQPRPLQSPRPPLTIAAHGPNMLRLAASHAEVWNSLGGMREGSPTAALAQTRERSARLDEFALAAGRDPRAIRRSFLAGFTPDRPFSSIDAFEDFVGRYRAIGIDEFIFFYRPRHATQELWERVATDVLPRLRSADN
jgi:alkanesulfonate monooxygenase SsuD/methylene tetrahydromethanopterin reductase-like flavin-dependent oxidoreductase (luciferase family)